jgi:hypothetical protein
MRGFENLLRHITGTLAKDKGLSRCAVVQQFKRKEVPYRLNAAFLICLGGKEHPYYKVARSFLKSLSMHPRWKNAARFYLQGLREIASETAVALNKNHSLRAALQEAEHCLKGQKTLSWNAATRSQLWGFFFPEGRRLERQGPNAIRRVRALRRLSRVQTQGPAFRDPAEELLLSSNLLLTLPLSNKNPKNLKLPSALRIKARQAAKRPQAFYFDHPMPLNAPLRQNEALRGLKSLDRALAFEKKRGTLCRDARIPFFLSLSATHEGLDSAASPFLRRLFEEKLRLHHLKVFLFTEKETRSLIRRILLPALKASGHGKKCEPLLHVFGVSGEYGRHYSFLKAMAAFWQVLVNPRVRATFKIDLDQVFPQKELVKFTQRSALEHLHTRLWGAKALDRDGNEIELGMIAGALVDKKDIRHSLYTPDALLPRRIPAGQAAVFYSPLARAVSTRAEMAPHGKTGRATPAIQRFHVLGGVNGIRISSLRKYRPFTPTFISRAEDQAYLMSALYARPQGNLRCVHQPGLIMRHDKDIIAANAVIDAEAGRGTSELLRLLQFSYFAQALPWPVAKTKACLDPFTGCFITPIPRTLALLRFSLYLAECFSTRTKKEARKGLDFQTLGIRRLSEAMAPDSPLSPSNIKASYGFEKKGWDMYYQALDRLEDKIFKNVSWALALRRNAQALLERCKLSP